MVGIIIGVNNRALIYVIITGVLEIKKNLKSSYLR